MFNSIIICKENFEHLSVTLSSMREATDSEDKKFNYYWLTLTDGPRQYICCTGKKFTELLGTDAKDADAKKAIIENLGKFQVSQAVDEDGEPIYINDEPDRPLLKIQAVAHSESCW